MSALAVWLVLACPVGVLAQGQPPLEAARAAYDARNFDDARRILQGLVRDGSRDPGVFQLLGVVERSSGRLKSAIAALEQAHALAPDSSPVAVELGVTLSWNRAFDRAIALFRQVLTREPGHAGARTGLGFALAWQGRLDEAGEVFSSMINENEANIDAWNGMGLVARSSFRRADAERAYRRVLELSPGNQDAAKVLEAVHWERRGEVRMLGGASHEPDAGSRGEARVDWRYAVSQKTTFFTGYQRYGFGAATPVTGGGILVSTRTEDSIEAGVISRPTDQWALAASVYTFFADGSARAIGWFEGAFKVAPRVTLIGALRPAFADTEPRWLMAAAAGAAVSVAAQHQITARALFAADTQYEPRLTTFVFYDAQWAPRFKTAMSVSFSRSDPAYDFTGFSGSATVLLTPAVGISVEGSRRIETFERSTWLVGVTLRR